MVVSPRCCECDAPVTDHSELPCWRCQRAWAWLIDEQDQELIASWDQTQDMIREATGARWLGLRVVAWQNRTLTLAGYERQRRWFARRYVDVTKAIVKTDRNPVLVTPRNGATMARKIKRDKENDDGTQ